MPSQIDVHGKFVLAADTVVLPAATLSSEVQTRAGATAEDYIISNPRTRSTSKVLSADAALFVQQLKSPKTIVQAVIDHSLSQGNVHPEGCLTDVLPVIGQLVSARMIVHADSANADFLAAQFLPGTPFADWQIGKQLHLLEDTEVYAVQSDTGLEAILKVGRESNQRICKLFDREAEILQRLHGSVSPKLFEYGKFQDKPFLILEHCPGDHVSSVASSLRFSHHYEDLRTLCKSVLSAYENLHGQGIIHGDVHPKNIIASGSSVKLIDFGMAIAIGSDEKIHRSGVALYFEPELAAALLQHRSAPQPSAHGEQYAVAALLFYLLTGKHYLDFSLEREVMLKQIAEQNISPLDSHRLSEGIYRVLARALKKDPNLRYASLTEFSAAFQRESDSSVHIQVANNDVPGKKFISQILDRFHPERQLFYNFDLTPPKASIQMGSAGIAYALYKFACLRDDRDLLVSSDLWINRSIAKAQEEHSFEAADLGITPEAIGAISLFHQQAGVHFVQALIGCAMGDALACQKSIAKFIESSLLPCDKLDLTLGKTSTLLGCSLLLEACRRNRYVDTAALVLFGNKCLSELYRTIASDVSILDCDQLTFFGIAHGWAGVLYGVLKWSSITHQSVQSSVPSRLSELRQHAEPHGDGVRWPIRTRASHKRDYMKGWCNGDAGMVHLWLLARSVLQDDSYLALACKTGQSLLADSSKSFNLCCGDAGIAYSVLGLYAATKQAQWLDLGRSYLWSAAESASNDSQFPFSLYKGSLGVALLAEEMNNSVYGNMPVFGVE